MSVDLIIQVELEAPIGWIQLEDRENGYELHKDALSSKTISHRKTDISSEWMAGTFTAHSVRDNAVEPIVFYVAGATPWEHQMRLDAATDALSQVSWRVRITRGNLRTTWRCNPSDYTVESTQELQVAQLSIVRASISHLPNVLHEEVVGP